MDEGADLRLGTYVSTLGHDVAAVAGGHLSGLGDRDILAAAHREQRVLITEDLGFGELVFRQNLPHSGVILLRLGKANLPMKTDLLNEVLEKYSERLGSFVVVTERAIRIRGRISQ